MDDKIATAAEATEADILPRVHEVHADPNSENGLKTLPNGARQPVAGKSPAQWAYERLIIYIQNFESQLDAEHEVAIGFAGGDVGVLRIEGMGYFDPDIVTFYGSDEDGTKTQLIQHVSQLNVMLQALTRVDDATPANRIGFRLAADLQKG